MKLREALINQAPSLTLQRAASSEIARLDNLVHDLLRAGQAAAHLLEGVAHVSSPGDTIRPLQLLRAAALRAAP